MQGTGERSIGPVVHWSNLLVEINDITGRSVRDLNSDWSKEPLETEEDYVRHCRCRCCYSLMTTTASVETVSEVTVSFVSFAAATFGKSLV
ncbi:hypothetical protein ACH5RR_010950 [Cinchona calisaya]|uniref:Uncharacterized protein n=1 Tax=Cinchona calisaya TaxID=153742 RepID=A0ABD3A4Y9_9GENT